MRCHWFSGWWAGVGHLPALWRRVRWLVLLLLGLWSVVYAFLLVRTPDTINPALFYWFIYSGGALIFAGLIEQGNNLERREQ